MHGFMNVKFFAPSKKAPGAHPASYTAGSGSFPGIKRTECGVDQPTTSDVEVKESVELYLYSPSGLSWILLR